MSLSRTAATTTQQARRKQVWQVFKNVRDVCILWFIVTTFVAIQYICSDQRDLMARLLPINKNSPNSLKFGRKRFKILTNKNLKICFRRTTLPSSSWASSWSSWSATRRGTCSPSWRWYPSEKPSHAPRSESPSGRFGLCSPTTSGKSISFCRFDSSPNLGKCHAWFWRWNGAPSLTTYKPNNYKKVSIFVEWRHFVFDNSWLKFSN